MFAWLHLQACPTSHALNNIIMEHARVLCMTHQSDTTLAFSHTRNVNDWPKSIVLPPLCVQAYAKAQSVLQVCLHRALAVLAPAP